MKYFLHYVSNGKNGIYGKEVFIREANNIGVNRSLPYFIIKKLKWGDKILLATFQSCHAGEKVESLNRKFQDGIADVFGFFVISGLNLVASPILKRELYDQLDIKKSWNSPQTYQRSCGSYCIEASYVVTNELADIIEKGQKIADRKNEKIKYFVAGSFHELKTKIEGVNFSRSIIEIELNSKLYDTPKNWNCVGFIKDYNKNVYIPKKERILTLTN